MSDYRSEASSRSAVKTELTSAHLECLLISLASGPSVARVVVACHWVTPGWNKAGHPLPCGRSSATFLTCVFSSQHFSSYPASCRSDVPSLCPRWRHPSTTMTTCPVGLPTSPLLPLSGTRRARSAGRPIGQTTSMRTTGAHDDWPTSAASQWCLRPSMPAVVRPRCCTSCGTELNAQLSAQQHSRPVRIGLRRSSLWSTLVVSTT
jgi:hypothetical protein